MEIEIRQVKVAEIIELRQLVLRPNRPLSSAHFESDNDEFTYHYAAYVDSDVIGCVSLMLKSHVQFYGKQTYQLRGMAVDALFQNNKIGQSLIKFAENQLKENLVDLVWCNVRTTAIDFYLKHDYLQIGNSFEIPDVGPHVLMFKNL